MRSCRLQQAWDGTSFLNSTGIPRFGSKMRRKIWMILFGFFSSYTPVAALPKKKPRLRRRSTNSYTITAPSDRNYSTRK
ncbi:hypothetical protein H6P81_003979 [Aristolochia fimbriata]|uniref:Uncharacterized protein n=1 Tax=Aristolochia fimbriata TaxID=158543 RepID=A0AAV7FF69_ARIFI|nr:hypothetical protein H6P81_003979 [Aristolochia fimbriata]